MVAVDLRIVDLVDERPLAGARVTVTLTVVPASRPVPILTTQSDRGAGSGLPIRREALQDRDG